MGRVPALRGDGKSERILSAMISEARAKYQRISPRKARVVVNLIRGERVESALQILDFTRRAGAPIVKKVVASALANARQKDPGVDVDALYVSHATVDQGPNGHLRRWRPRAMGRATQITKGVSHIHIQLDSKD